MKLNVTQILETALADQASDLHFSIGAKPFVRISGQLEPLTEYEPLTLDDLENILSQLLEEQQREIFEINKETRPATTSKNAISSEVALC